MAFLFAEHRQLAHSANVDGYASADVILVDFIFMEYLSVALNCNPAFAVACVARVCRSGNKAQCLVLPVQIKMGLCLIVAY